VFIVCLGQHCALALLSPTATGVFGFELVGYRFVTHQPVIERQFFPAPYLTTSLDKDAPLHFNRLAVGAARMIDPARGIAAVKAINHTCVVDVKVKRVLGVTGVMRVAALRFGHGNDFAHIFDDGFARGHGAQGKHAFAVHTRGQHFDLQWIPLSGYYEAPQRFEGARAMLILTNHY
jgi:hypothetical protein